MIIAVLSDIHANLEALAAVVADARGEGAGRFACLGDVVGYNADPVACVDLVRGLPCLPCIRGNHDEMAAGNRALLGINRQAFEAMTWTRLQLDEERRAWLGGLPLLHEEPDAAYVHASLHEPAAWHYVHDAQEAAASFAGQSPRVCFIGHSHQPGGWRDDGHGVKRGQGESFELAAGERWLVNVGSVGQPRDHDPRASYALYDADGGHVRLRRVAYDIASAQAKILAAGLPEQLAKRLG
jgi:diadenosine tetraphosphatase ApaH/serine/threonine PP2A family protein phosphatase